MKILLGGVRGSTPVCEPEYAAYGGSTTSVLVEGDDGTHVVVDAGSGLRSIGSYLEEKGSFVSLPILMTHYHLDHIIGFPTFSALYDPTCSLNIAAPNLQDVNVQEALSRVMENPFWPVALDASAARLSFTALGTGNQHPQLVIDGLTISWCAVHHPGGCTAYRFDEPATGQSLVFATDIEWQASSPEEKDVFLRFCADPIPPELLVFDGQYSNQNYSKHVGWGHSTWQDAIDVAHQVSAGQLLVTHHCASNNDEALAAIETELQKIMRSASLARQGQVVSLVGRAHA